MGGMGGQTHATGVVSNTASPVWSESLRFEPAQLGDTLEATVMRKRRGRSSKAIGSVSVPLANLADGMPRYAWLPLTARERGAGEGGGDGGVGRVMETGELHLRLRWRDDVAEEDSGTVVIEAVLGGVGLLVVDSGMLDMHTRTPRELVYASLSAVELTLRRTPTKETLRVAVQSIQVDNQLLSSGHPVMLGRSAHAYALPRAAADVPGLSETSAGKPYRQIAEAEAAVPPMLEVRWDRQFTNPTIQFFKLFTVVIQEMDLVVEEELIDAVVSMGARLPWDDLWQGRGGGKTTKAPGQELQSLIERLASSGDVSAADLSPRKYYFELFLILPIRVNISVVPYAAGRGANAGLDYLTDPRLGSAMRLFRSLGINLLDIDNVPVHIGVLELRNVMPDHRQLMNDMCQFYQSQAIHEVYKILGTVDILAPVSFVANVSYGVLSLFLASKEGSARSVALALAEGTGSLMKSSVYGTFLTAGQMVDGFAKGFSMLALDDQYLLRSRRRPTGVLSGLSLGAQDLVSGFVDGVAGLVKAPLVGAEKAGTVGFARGLATGVLGIAFKPVSGVLEFTSKAVAGVAASVQRLGVRGRPGAPESVSELSRARNPRVGMVGAHLGSNETLCAKWTEVVRRVRAGRYRTEHVVDFLQNKPNKAVLLTNDRVVYLNLKKRQVRWTARYGSISQVQTFGLALVLLCRVHYRRLHMTMPRKRLLVCQTRELQNSLLAKLTLMMEGASSGSPSTGVVPRDTPQSDTESGAESGTDIPDDVDLSIMMKDPSTMLQIGAARSSAHTAATSATTPSAPTVAPTLTASPGGSPGVASASPARNAAGARSLPRSAPLSQPQQSGSGAARGRGLPTVREDSVGVAGSDGAASPQPRRLEGELRAAAGRGVTASPLSGKRTVGQRVRGLFSRRSREVAGGAEAAHEGGGEASGGEGGSERRAVRRGAGAGVGAGAVTSGGAGGDEGAAAALEARLNALESVAGAAGDGPMPPAEAEALGHALRVLCAMCVEALDGDEVRARPGSRGARQFLASINEWARRLGLMGESPGPALATIRALCGATRRAMLG